MNLMGLFRSPQNELEKGGKQPKNPQEESHEITMTCPKCGTQTPVSELWDTPLDTLTISATETPSAAASLQRIAMLGLAASFSISTSIPLLMLARRDSSSSDIFFALR